MDPRLLQAVTEVMSETLLPSAAVQQGVAHAGAAAKSHLLESGLRMPASTGTPTMSLHGAPRTRTQLSNIGGGSLLSGGSGMAGGGARLAQMDKAALSAQIATAGVTGLVMGLRVWLRYRELCIADELAAAANNTATENTTD